MLDKDQQDRHDTGAAGNGRSNNNAVPPESPEVSSDEAVAFWEDEPVTWPPESQASASEETPQSAPPAQPDAQSADAPDSAFHSISQFLALHSDMDLPDERAVSPKAAQPTSPVVPPEEPLQPSDSHAIEATTEPALEPTPPASTTPESVEDEEPEAIVQEAIHPVSPESPEAIEVGSAPMSEPQPDAEADLQEEPETESNFFDIPDEVPETEHEDTAAPLGVRKRRVRRKPSALRIVSNVLGWLFMVVLFLAVLLGLLYYRYASDRLYNEQFAETREVAITVNPGDRFPQILANLKREGLLGTYMGIDDKYLLIYLTKMRGDSEKIKAGAYRLSSNMSLQQVYDKLIEGSQDFKITFPEGKTSNEIASIAKRRNDAFNPQTFIELTKDPAFINSVGLKVPTLEGYLYPSTYFFGPGMKEAELARLMVKTFRETVEENLRGVEKRDALTFHEHVIMASLIEREARIEADRPLIASVIYNRLKKNMPLMIDATVHYAINDWSRALTYTDLKVDSPFNTYREKGLPPAPICNPRVSSILATFQPAETDYLYYVLKGDGSHAFSRTFEEHKANVRLYRKSRPDVSDQEKDSVEPATATPSPEPKRTASRKSPTPAPSPEPTSQPARDTESTVPWAVVEEETSAPSVGDKESSETANGASAPETSKSVGKETTRKSEQSSSAAPKSRKRTAAAPAAGTSRRSVTR